MKLLKIDNCWKCPDFYHEEPGGEYFYKCWVGKRTVPNPDRIPEWCPLPDTSKD